MSDKIMITCPAETVAVWTGFKASPGATLSGLKRVTMRQCPACGQEHTWNGENAYWEEDAPEPSVWEAFRNIWRKPSQN
jgi:hypothetical protein